MQIISIQENQKEQWDKFIASNPSGSFLQSWSWGKFQESLGKKVWRLSIIENNEISLAALIIKQDLPFGWSYLYCPKGPLINPKSQIPLRRQSSALYSYVATKESYGASATNPKLIKLFFKEIKKLAEKEKTVFLRIDPAINSSLSLCKEKLSGIFYPTKPIQPQHSLILDITKSEEEILAQMKQKTRYNIRLAEKKGVKIKKISQPNNQEIQTLWDLLIKTSKRDRFRTHPQKYYQKMFEALNQKSMLKLFFAEYQKKVITANIVVFFSDKAVYLHGASSNENRNVMAPYLLQWEQIKEAKRLSCQSYDFWGIEKQPAAAQSAWAGITKFKKGFGGEEISYPESWDFIFNLVRYWIYRVGKKIL